MKNIFKRVVASLLVAVMLFGSAPIESLTNIDLKSMFSLGVSATKKYTIEGVAVPETVEYNIYKISGGLDDNYYKANLSKYDKTSSKWSTDWQYWSQGATQYFVMLWGCRNVAYSKLLAECGIISPYNVNPDDLFIWGCNNGFYNRYNMNELKTTGHFPVEYAKSIGKTSLKFKGSVSLKGSWEQKCQKVMEEINKGHQVILACNNHYCYVGYEASLSANEPILFDSSSSKSQNANFVCYMSDPWQSPAYNSMLIYEYDGQIGSQSYYSQIKWETKDKYYYVTGKNGAAIRSQPFDGDNSVGRMNKGDKFIVLGEVYVKETKHTWYYAEFTDSTGKTTKGYVYKNYVAKSNNDIPPAVITKAYEDGSGTVRPLDGRLHKKGESFRILGNVRAYKNNITEIYAITTKYNSSTSAYDIKICETKLTVNTKNYTLTKSSGDKDVNSINTKLIFKGLDVGYYNFYMMAKCGDKEVVLEDALFEVSDKITSSQSGKASEPPKVKAPSLLSEVGKWVSSNFKSIVTYVLTPKRKLVDTSNLIAYADIPDDPNSGVGSGGILGGGSGSSSSGSSTPSAPVSNGYKLGVYRITATSLNIRKGPGTSHGYAGNAIPKGKEITITEVSSNGWGKTKYNGAEGWVSMNYCTYVREVETVRKPDAPNVKLATDANVPTGAIVSATWLGTSDTDSYTAYLKNSSGMVVATQAGIKGNSASFTVADAGTYTITVAAVNSKYSTESAPTAAFTVHAPLTVSFVDWDGRTETRIVPYGGAAIAPDAPTREGYTFQGWDKEFNKVTQNLTVNAKYKINTYTVKFVDYNNNPVGKIQTIEYKKDAVPPEVVAPTGYRFVGWSNDSYNCVKSDCVVEAIYEWKNASLPIVVEITKAVRWNDGYSVTFELNNTNNSVTTGRAIVSLKTTEGKLVEMNESAAFSIPNGQIGQVTKTVEVFVPSESPAAVAEVMIVDNYTSGVPLSESDTLTVNLGLEWSAWSTKYPDPNIFDPSKDQLESRTEYRYRKMEFTTAYTKTLTGWGVDSYGNPNGQPYNKRIEAEYRGSTTAPQYNETRGDSYEKTVTVRPVENKVYNTEYIYTHYVNSAMTESSYKKQGKYTIGPHTYRSNQALNYRSDSDQNVDAWGGKGYGYKCGVSGCQSTWWYNQIRPGEQVIATTTTVYYDYVERYYIYDYKRWGTWSDWSTNAVNKSSTMDVETRTTYRYKKENLDVQEDKSGSFINIDKQIDPSFAGKLATVFVHKYNEASDWTCEYTGQIKIGDNGRVNFSFKPREELSEITGDFTISLGIEGCTDIVLLERIEAPKPEYKVVFMDLEEDIVIAEKTVSEGSAVIPPEVPEKEGYTFLCWEADLSCVDSEMIVNARYIQNEYTVVFVDWTNKVVLTKQFMHGDYLVPPELTVPEGYKHTGWENVTLGETVVTSNMVLTAEFEKLTYEVSFYDFDNNLISTQTVEYGETPDFVDAPEKDNHIFTEWESPDNTLTNTSGKITLYPRFVFAETVTDPVASIESGTYSDVQTVELTCETEGAVIYYTLDGSDPTEGGMEYTGPITVDRSMTVKFCAYAFEKNDSEVVTKHYAVNTADSNTVSDWMLQEELPDYVVEDSETYTTEYAVGYRYKDVTTSSSYTSILDLENNGWTNEGFTYSEWSDWLIYEPSFNDLSYEVESQQPASEEEMRYLYTRFKYKDAETGEYVYTYQEVEGVEGEWEEYLTPLKLNVAGYVSGTQVKYYDVDGEKWYNQSITTVEVVPDYLMYRYRTKEYTLTKWTGWTTDAPAEGESRETEKDTVYRYFIPMMYVVNIVPDYSKFGTETITFIVEANKKIEIDEADYQYLGHDFVGFYTDTGFTNYWNHKTETVTSELTLYPKYKAHTFEVVFVDYDGTVLSEETVEYGASALAPEVAERDGYVFIGWDNDSFDSVTETMVVTAQYVTEEEYCKVTLSHSRYNLMVGTSFALTATVTPEDAENKNLNWYTDDPSVAVVNDEGVVTGVSEGVAIITVEAEATGEMVECLVNVSKNPSESLCLIPGSRLGIDEANGLLRGVSNTDCTVESIKNEFMNADLVFTDKNGNVLEDTALAGTGTVISFTNGGKVVDEITIVVTGDMTGDGKVNNRDVAMMLSYLVDKATADDAQMVAIDVNGDGYVNNRDAAMVSRYLVGKETI